MIQRFRFGLPLPTDSVVQEIPVSAGPVPFLTAEEDGWAYRMAPDAIVYGLGEMPRGINKRGWRFGLFGQRFFVIGTVIDAGAYEHLARQRSLGILFAAQCAKIFL